MTHATNTTTTHTTPANSQRWRTWTLWTIQILLALAFAIAGGQKLAGVPAMVTMFDDIGYGQWFRIMTGALEITGAVLILLPRTVVLGALLLTAIGLGAMLTHIVLIGGSPLPAIGLMVLAGVVVMARTSHTRLSSNAEPV